MNVAMSPEFVMSELARICKTVGLRAYPFLADSVSAPAVIVDFPEEVSYDQTMGRGVDRMAISVWVVATRSDVSTGTTQLSGYMQGVGATSVKQVIETASSEAWDVVRVESAEFSPIDIGGTSYLGAKFTLDIVGTSREIPG